MMSPDADGRQSDPVAQGTVLLTKHVYTSGMLSRRRADFTHSHVVTTTGSAKRRKLEAGSDGLAARINRELERSLRDFVALATVSRDPGYREDCFRGAKFLGTLLESLGKPPCCPA